MYSRKAIIGKLLRLKGASRSSAWLLRLRAPSKKAVEASSNSQEVVMIGITTRIETAATVKTVAIRYRFKAKVNRFTTATRQDKTKARINQVMLMANLRQVTKIRDEIADAAIKTETIRKMLVAMAVTVVAEGVVVAGIR